MNTALGYRVRGRSVGAILGTTVLGICAIIAIVGLIIALVNRDYPEPDAKYKSYATGRDLAIGFGIAALIAGGMTAYWVWIRPRLPSLKQTIADAIQLETEPVPTE